jgi:hypothetical protein
MAAKFVIGLTDVNDNGFAPNQRLYDSVDPYLWTDWNPTWDAYSLSDNIDLSIEKSTIEWQLDVTLPAVVNLINVYKAVRSKRLHTLSVLYSKGISPETGFLNADIFIELSTLVPFRDINFPLYTDVDYDNLSTDKFAVYGSLELDSMCSYEHNGIGQHNTLSYAKNENTFDLLPNGPAERVVYPAFRINFITSSTTRTTTKSMSIDQKIWMLNNKDVLESKGYYVSDNKTKIGGLVIGDLIGNYEDAFVKIQTYNKVCRIDIIED